MPELNGERQVMVRDWFSVPAVPSETLKQVFGSRAVDPRVELVALVFEYWINAGATSRLTLHEILKILPGRIDPHIFTT